MSKPAPQVQGAPFPSTNSSGAFDTGAPPMISAGERTSGGVARGHRAPMGADASWRLAGQPVPGGFDVQMACGIRVGSERAERLRLLPVCSGVVAKGCGVSSRGEPRSGFAGHPDMRCGR